MQTDRHSNTKHIYRYTHFTKTDMLTNKHIGAQPISTRQSYNKKKGKQTKQLNMPHSHHNNNSF